MLQKGVTIKGIFNYNNKSDLLRMVKKYSIEFSVFYDPQNKFMNELQINSGPGVIIVDDRKQIIGSHFLDSELKLLYKNFFKIIKAKCISET